MFFFVHFFGIFLSLSVHPAGTILLGDDGRTQLALCYVPIKGLTQVRGMDECMGDDPSFPACGTAKTEWLSWVLSPHSGLAGTTTRRTTPGG